MSKLSAARFAAFLVERERANDGYIMGTRGQNPKIWGTSSWWFKQYSGSQKTKALYWRKNAERVWDCQGLSEGYINEMLGINIDVRARNNYATWCDPKGKGVIPAQYRMKGAAVFKAYASGTIHHVGYLVEPVNPEKPEGDWYIIEAKGVMYGVVRTKLSDGGWNRWGLMTKYFDYEDAEPEPAPEFGDRALCRGMEGDDVRALQGMLIELGFDCGKWGTDGDFGADTEKAVKKFQKEYRLPVTGIVDSDDYEALRDGALPDDPDEPEPTPVYFIDALDLSSHNATNEPKIDWEKIKKQVGVLILRCGCTRVTTKPLGIGADAYFERWAQKCNEYGIPFWAYYYSHAKDTAQARKEAEFTYAIAMKYKPVGYCMDCEEPTLKKAIIGAWFDTIRKLGADRTMIYVAHHLYNRYNLDTDNDGFIAIADAVWPPRYGKNTGEALEKYRPAFPHDLWQFTSKFKLDGIPDKTLDANIVSGQRRTLAWFRGEE